MTEEEPVFEESSPNVFADVGLEDADELFTPGKIGLSSPSAVNKNWLL
ncbi:hypothetical protein [Brasilonema bromeliae]|nr:hypothetical protein [Brasilonema bromeliae]